MQTQEKAVEKLAKLKVGALFCETGTGKTKIALDLMASRIDKVDAFVWVCPASLQNEIEQERLKWHKELTLQVFSCEGIASSERIYSQIMAILTKKRVFLVLDESLKIKNPKAKTTKRMIALGAYAEYKLVLNGTPLSNNILDIWAQMQFLSPLILKQTYRQFKEMYCVYSQVGKRAGVVKECVNIPHLMSRISPYIFEAKLDISPKTKHITQYYRMYDSSAYDNLKKSLLESYEKSSQNANFWYSIITKLQHYYCNNSNRACILEQLLKEINEQAIVFCNFRSSIPEDAVAITGSVPHKKRKEIIDSFRRSDFQTLYIMRGCGSFGLNLQFCHKMIFAEQTWDYAAQLQGEARIYRMGQENDVTYYHLICEDVGLEQMIAKNQERKGGLLQLIKQTINNADDQKAAVERLISQL